MSEKFFKLVDGILWADWPEPSDNYPRGDEAVWEHNKVLEMKAALRAYNSRPHYPLSGTLVGKEKYELDVDFKTGEVAMPNKDLIDEGKILCFSSGEKYEVIGRCNEWAIIMNSKYNRHTITNGGWLEYFKFEPVAIPIAQPVEGEKEEIREIIVGILYASKTDEADDGSWIESKDFYKVADAIVKKLKSNL